MKNSYKCYIQNTLSKKLDYKKKKLNHSNFNSSYEEIDTRLASGWYVDSFGNDKKKRYKTKEVSFTVSKKTKVWSLRHL